MRIAKLLPKVTAFGLTALLLPFAKADDETPHPSIPTCVGCNKNNRQEFSTYFGIDLNPELCSTPTAYRKVMVLNTKFYCANGGYWVCEQTSTMTCTAQKDRNGCPSDACAR